MRIDDLKNEVDGIYARVRKLETHDPLGNASVSRGSTRFLGNESLKVVGSALISGWLIVTGNLKVVGSIAMEGVFNATGRAKFAGPVEITETLDVSAETVLRGATTINNTLDVAASTTLRGALSLLANLVVGGGGKITVGGVIIEPTGGGQIRFGNMMLGPAAVGGVSGITATSGTLALSSAGQVNILASSGVTITAGDGVTIQSTVAIKDLPIASGIVYMVVADASGRLYRKAVAA